jgi:hypothetical protein
MVFALQVIGEFRRHIRIVDFGIGNGGGQLFVQPIP